MRNLTRLAAVVAVLLVAPPIVHAQDADDAEITKMAKEHYKLGVDAFKAARYPEAIKELKKAYLLKRLPPLLVNIAKTYDKLNDPDNAIYYYKKYLAEAPPDVKDRESVKQALADLEYRKANPDQVADAEPPEAPRPRGARDEADEEAPPPRRTRKPAPVQEEEEEAPAPRKARKPAPVVEEAAEEAPPPRKTRRAQPIEEEAAEEAPPPRRTRKAAPVEEEAAEEAPPPRRTRKAPVVEEDAAEPAPPPRRRAAPEPVVEAPPPRKARPAVAMPSEWAHSPIDSAPPNSPIDVRVQTPVMKGVKVFLFYRAPGSAEFTPVLMKRRGAEKIGRIPPEAVTGKSVQYYLEAKDATGVVVKSSGTQLDPNIVMVDATAPPQIASASGARTDDESDANRGEEGATDEGSTEPPAAKPRPRNLDDEQAPMGRDQVAHQNTRNNASDRQAKTSSGPHGKVFSTMGWVGIGLMAGGVAAAVTGGVLLYQASTFGTAVANDAADPFCNTQNSPMPLTRKCQFNDPAFDPSQTDFAFQNSGKLFNGLGIGFTVGGGVLAAAGAVLVAIDYTRLHKAAPVPDKAPPKKRRARPRPSEEESSVSPSLIRNFLVAPTFSPSGVGAAASFSF